LVTAITDTINMRFAASTNQDSFKEDDVFGGNSNTGGSFYDPYTGIYTPLLKWSLDATSGKYLPTATAWPDPTKSDIYADLTVAKYYDTMFQHDFAGRWDLSGVTLSPIAGWMYQDRHGTNWERQKYLGAYNLLKFPRDPLPHPARSTYDLTDTDINEKKKLFQTYLYTQVGLLDQRVIATVGWSRVNVDNKTTDYNSNGDVSTLKGGHDTYAASVLGKVAPNVSVYYGYSTNAQATDAGRGAPPRWRDGTQHEFGLKSEFLDKRLSASAAYFRISQNNISTPNPLRQLDPTQPGVLYQDINNNGIELEVVGGVTKNLSIVASYTKMHYRDTLGRRVRNVPDEMENLLANYHFTKEFSVFVGLQHTGDLAVETAPTSATALGVVKQVSAYLAPFTIVNAGGQYRVGRFKINLDVDNVLNTRALYETSGRGGIAGYPYINPKLSVRYEF
jgi:iron complex outermembrane receptor protein